MHEALNQLIDEFKGGNVMEFTVKAVLARCGGNHDKAREYCAEMMRSYPALRHEYEVVRREIGRLQ